MCCCSSAETFGQGWERVANAMWQFGERRGGEERKCEKPGEFSQRSGQKSSPLSATNSIKTFFFSLFRILWSFLVVINVVFCFYASVFLILFWNSVPLNVFSSVVLSKDNHRRHLQCRRVGNVDFVHTTLWNSLGQECLKCNTTNCHYFMCVISANLALEFVISFFEVIVAVVISSRKWQQQCSSSTRSNLLLLKPWYLDQTTCTQYNNITTFDSNDPKIWWSPYKGPIIPLFTIYTL